MLWLIRVRYRSINLLQPVGYLLQPFNDIGALDNVIELLLTSGKLHTVREAGVFVSVWSILLHNFGA